MQVDLPVYLLLRPGVVVTAEARVVKLWVTDDVVEAGGIGGVLNVSVGDER